MAFVNYKIPSLHHHHLKPVTRNIIKTRTPATINGIELGIPLNIIDNVFTNLHYGYDITTIKIVLLQFLIGYYTYGKDRYKDALEYYEQPEGEDETNIKMKIKDSKLKLYEGIYNEKDKYIFAYNFVFLFISSLLLFDENHLLNLPIVIALYSTEYYKDYKTSVVGFKPVYVATMWTISAVILPCLLYDNNYDIINYPGHYLPCFLSLFASTNFADVKDIEEDTMNNIETLPVAIGQKKTNMIIMGSLALSSFLFGINQNYLNRPIINSLFEIQNAAIASIVFFY
uniref:Prenyltransferase Protein n=1 Tax=Florenciella sp. virus SA2 TaxID=3240092 RepID=A0AB39J835_9VIRU